MPSITSGCNTLSYAEVEVIREGDPNSGKAQLASLVATVGVILAPIVGLLVVIELVMAASQI
jgi:hypothetical protein